jgi:hypothetical protein
MSNDDLSEDEIETILRESEPKKRRKDKPLSVILLVATYNSSNRFEQWAEFIYQLRPKPDLVIFAENNSTDNTLELLRNFKLPHEIIRVNFVADVQLHLGPYGAISNIRDLLLTRARQLNPDYAIFVDDDVFIFSVDAIKRLTSWKKDIVGGAYLRDFPEGLYIASKWNVEGKPFMRDWVEQSLEEVTMTSGGCMCLSRKVLQDRRLHFSPVEEDKSEDFGFCWLARTLGYTVWLDGITKIGHGEHIKYRAWVGNKHGLEPFYFNNPKNQEGFIRGIYIPLYKKPENISRHKISTDPNREVEEIG